MFWKVCLIIWIASSIFFFFFAMAVGLIEAYKYRRHAKTMGLVYCGENHNLAETIILLIRMMVIACIPIYNTIACLCLVFAYDRYCDSLQAAYEKNYCAPDELPPNK